jgi:hypothetical protein
MSSLPTFAAVGAFEQTLLDTIALFASSFSSRNEDFLNLSTVKEVKEEPEVQKAIEPFEGANMSWKGSFNLKT